MTRELSHIPAAIVAGDAIHWRLSLPEYPAAEGWAASYVLIAAEQQIVIDSSAAGDDHLVDLTSTITADYTPGRYDYRLYVTKDGNRYTLMSGKVEIQADFVPASTGLDVRSPAERTLDLLLATYDKLAARALASKSGGSIATTDKELTELREQISKQRAIVVTERRRKAISDGRRPGSQIKVRFMR